MDEFVKLFLRGKYAEDMKHYQLLVRIFALAGFALMAISVALAWQDLPLWASAVFSVAAFAAEGVAATVDLGKPNRLLRLSLGQNAENALSRAGEVRTRHERVFRAYSEAFGGFSSWKRFFVLWVTRILAPAALAVSCLLVSAGIAVDNVLLLAFIIFALLSGVAGVYDAVLESRARSKFYRLAQDDIDAIKREELHIAREKIAREAENARAASSVPVPVELFLKEDTELEDLRAVNRKGGIVGIALGVLYFLVLVAGMACGNALETLGTAASWSVVLSVFAAIFVLSFVSVFPITRRQSEIYARNFRKLKETEADKLRGELQSAWLRSQRAGNIMFGCFTAGAIALGVTLGLFGYFTGTEGMPLSQSLAVSILPILVYAAILSLVVWTVMYALARRKMRPLENQLRELVRTEKS